MTESPITALAIIAGVVALFGWVIKLVLPRLLNKIDQKDDEIRKLTIAFTEVQNHKTTELTEALKQLMQAENRHAAASEAQTEVFKQLIKQR